MKVNQMLGALLVACALGGALGASPQEARPRLVEPRADQALRAMSERLAGLSRFAFEAEETFDEIPDGEPRMQLNNVRRVAVERPNRLAGDADGDTLNRAVWYDGKTVTFLDKAHNTYGRVQVPPTIDSALDHLAERYGIVAPLEDLLYSDPYAVLTENVLYGRYQGLHRAAGVLCHHLAFVQDTIEWQIWIDAGDDPLPRKFVITYVREEGEPQYSAILSKWHLDPAFPEDLFTFHAPPGAEQVEVGGLMATESSGELRGQAHEDSRGAGASRPDGGVR